MDELKKSIGYLQEFEKALLEKFHYIVNEDGTYTVTAWKKEYRSENAVRTCIGESPRSSSRF